MTDLLNWAGLIVNGLIAFVFPIGLCYYVFVFKPQRYSSSDIEQLVELSEFDSRREISITQSPRSISMPDSPPHEALFPSLQPYRTYIISTIFVLFLFMITTTIVVNLYEEL